jgi:5-methylthioadenosine/S-adenosylhomocysteine deaminase
VLTNTAVIVENGRISKVLPSEQADQEFPDLTRTELPGHLVTPGFVNAHTHVAMSLLRGYADDLPLQDWLNNRIWPAEGKWVSDEFVYDGAVLSCYEMLLGGTTTFNDMYFFPEATARAADAMGMRASLGIILIDFPSAYGSGPDDYLRKGLALRDQYNQNELISFCLAPHAPYTVSDDAFKRVATLADELQLPVHVHLHETAFEVEESVKQHGERPIGRLAKLGLVGPGLIAVHAVHLDESEIETLAKNNCSVAHCPHSNLKLGSGIAPISDLLAAGVTVGIGTDGSASNNKLDLLAETRTAALLAKGASADAASFGAAQALEAMTLSGAKALGLEHEIGSISAGKRADLVAIDLSAPQMQPVFDPVSQLIYAADRTQVSDVWIGGRHVAHRQQLTESSGRNALSEVVARIPVWQNRLSDVVDH